MNLSAIYHAKNEQSAFWVTWREYVKSHFIDNDEEKAEALLEKFGYINHQITITNMSENRAWTMDLLPSVTHSCFDQLLTQTSAACGTTQWTEVRMNIKPYMIGITFHCSDNRLDFIVRKS